MKRTAHSVVSAKGRVPPIVAWLPALLLGLLPDSRLGAAAPAPEISLSLRGTADQTVEQGEPLRIAVRIRAPRGTEDAITLSPAVGTWADAIAVELYPATGTAMAARADPVGNPDAVAATLDATRVAGGLWRFSPEAMQAVAPGAYRLRVHLNIDSGDGWKGVVAAREIPLTVLTPATKPSVQHIVNLAQDLLLTDQVQAAAAVVDAALKKSPRDYALLKVRALIAEKAGNPLAAGMCLNAANFSTVRETAGQPPAEDAEMLARLEKSRQTAPANPPAWSWPPTEVLTALAEEAQRSSFISALPPEPPAGARIGTTPTGSVNPPLRASVPDNPVPAATPIPSVIAPAPPTAQPPVANGNAIPLPAAPAGPTPGVIVPAADLNDARIIVDPSGQWAVSAVAGSQYGNTQYSAARATGAPNVPVAGNSPDAWCPANKSSGTDWLEVSFADPVPATEVRVRQNDAPGAIAKIEAIDSNGTSHLWWEGVDPFVATTRDIVWFAVRVPRTDYAVAKVKITLNLAAGPGWKEIDAVQLVGAQ